MVINDFFVTKTDCILNCFSIEYKINGKSELHRIDGFSLTEALRRITLHAPKGTEMFTVFAGNSVVASGCYTQPA